MPPEEQVTHVWTIGSYTPIARDFLPMAAHLVDAAGVGEDDRVLDVACGTGNVAITAARRGARVTGIDITPAMLEEARENAEIAGTDVTWEDGNATDLPYEDDSFDVTLSCVGHVFAQPPDESAQELVRVTRPGGSVAFTSWTPRSMVPAMARVMQEYRPANPDAPEPPFLWGDPDVVRERLGDGVVDVAFQTATLDQPAMSPAHLWEGVRTNSGLFIVALDDVDDDDVPALRADVIEAIEEYFDEGSNTVSLEYGLTSATVR